MRQHLFITLPAALCIIVSVALFTWQWQGAGNQLSTQSKYDWADMDPTIKPAHGDLWADRYTYPTFAFDQRWLTEARKVHDAIPTGLPAGTFSAARRGESDLPADRFTLLGPKPLGTGISSFAGRVNAVLSDPRDSSVAYLGSDGGGVWKTTNCCSADTEWTPLLDDPQFNSIAIGHMVFDPNNPDIVYAGTGDLRYGSFNFGSAGLLRSKDAGATFEILGEDIFGPALPTPVNSFPQYQAVGQVEVNPNDSTNIIVGTKTGLFLSYDDGANWTGPCVTNSFNTQRQDVTGLLLHDNGADIEIMVAVGTRGGPTPVQPDLDQNGANGIYETVLPASGCPLNWQLISRADNGWPAGTGEGQANAPIGRLEIARAPTNPDILYAEAVSATSLSLMGVWRSTDGGDTWVQRANAGEFTGGGCTIGGQSWYYAGILVSPVDADQLYLSSLDLYRSDDGGDSFQGTTCNANISNVHVDHHARAYVNNDPSRLLVGSDGGVYYSENADTTIASQVGFQHMNTSLPTIEFYSGDITANFATSSNRGAAGGAQDNGSSVVVWDGPVEATNWTRILGGDGVYSRLEPVLGNRWYAESQNGNLTVSTNGPFGPYSSVNGPWGGDRLSFLFPYEIYKHDCPATGCEHLIAGSDNVWETITGGLNNAAWYENSPDLTKGVLANRSFITQLAFSINDESIAIAGTNDGNVWFGFEMGQGLANSSNWVDVTGGNSVLPNRPILDVVTHPLNPRIGYAAVGGFSENTPSTPGHVYQVDCNLDCSNFEWRDISGNLPNIPVDSIMVNPLNPNQVFAGTDWGLYFTDDAFDMAPVWMRFTAGLPSAMIWDMAIDRGFTALAVFTRSRGAYAMPLPAETGEVFSSGFEG